MEDGLNMGLQSFRSEKHDRETTRSKRNIDEAEIKKAIANLEKLEGRWEAFCYSVPNFRYFWQSAKDSEQYVPRILACLIFRKSK